MTLSSLGIARKLSIGFGCVLLTVTVMSGALFISFDALKAASELNSKSCLVVDDLDQAIAALYEESRASLRFLTTRDDRFVALYAAAVKSFSDHLAQARARAAARPDILTSIDSVEATGNRFRNDVSDPAVRLARDNPTAYLALELTKSDHATEVLAAFKAAAADAREKVNAWSESAQARFDQLMSVLNATVVAGGGAAIIAALAIGWWMSRIIAGPVNAMTGVMNKLAGGDLSIEICGLGRKDEIGSMAAAVQAFKTAALKKVKRDADEAEAIKRWQKEDEERAAKEAEAAREDQVAIAELAKGLERLADGDLVYRIETQFASKTAQLRTDFNAALEKLQKAMLGIRENADGIASGSAEIASAADDLSRRTERQAGGLEETAATLDQITATVKTTADGALRAQSVVLTAKSCAKRSPPWARSKNPRSRSARSSASSTRSLSRPICLP